MHTIDLFILQIILIDLYSKKSATIIAGSERISNLIRNRIRIWIRNDMKSRIQTRIRICNDLAGWIRIRKKMFQIRNIAFLFIFSFTFPVKFTNLSIFYCICISATCPIFHVCLPGSHYSDSFLTLFLDNFFSFPLYNSVPIFYPLLILSFHSWPLSLLFLTIMFLESFRSCFVASILCLTSSDS
jgi:hypothetical protein